MKVSMTTKEMKRNTKTETETEMETEMEMETETVGTLKDGYVRKVPLPRAPRIQHASAMRHPLSHASHTRDTCYLAQVPRIPTWSDLTRSLAGLGRSVLQPFSPLLM